MTKFVTIIAGFVVLACVLMVAVSGALESQAAAVDDRLVRVPRRETAQVDHMSAANYFIEAAERCCSHAAGLEERFENEGAADLYKKAAAMYAIAGEHEKMQLADNHAQMISCQLQSLMHEKAGSCYSQVAEVHAVSFYDDQAIEMNQAAAEQYEASAACASACGHFVRAAHVYSLAADKYEASGDADKAQLMKEAVAAQCEAHAVDQLARDREHGRDCVSADVALAFRESAIAYESAGNVDKARAMNEVSAKLYEACAVQPVPPGERQHGASLDHRAADAYEAAGQLDKARLLWRAAAEMCEAAAVAAAQDGQTSKKKMVVSYHQAARLYKKSGDFGRAASMKEAASQLE